MAGLLSPLHAACIRATPLAIMTGVSTTKPSRLCGLMLALCLVVLVGLRLRWVGHLLVWDEAMNLCALRAFLAGGSDDFSNWFWRHPPLFCLLMMLVRPMTHGFAERVELVTIGLSAVNGVLMFAINRRLFSLRTALWSLFLLAVMPGSIFFDVWVKRDLPAATLGLLAILLLLHRRLPTAALCLGLAFLSKETALFYAMACGALWVFGAAGQRTWKGLVVLLGIPLLTCGWWYGWLSTANHVEFAIGRDTGFNTSWLFYVQRAAHDLGGTGVVLAALGAVALACGLPRLRGGRREGAMDRPTWVARAWPLWVLAPTLLLLSTLPSKVPWVVIVLFPAWATLQAIGVTAVGDRLGGLSMRLAGARRPILLCGMGGLLAAGLLWPVVGRDYDATLKETAEGQWRGATYSREIAETMNRKVADGERVLMTSFHYWTQLMPAHACAVFAYYFERDAAILLRSHERSFEDLRDDIETYRLDWALLSPEPGVKEREVFGGFMDTLGLRPERMQKAYLFRTTALYNPPPGDHGVPTMPCPER